MTETIEMNQLTAADMLNMQSVPVDVSTSKRIPQLEKIHSCVRVVRINPLGASAYHRTVVFNPLTPPSKNTSLEFGSKTYCGMVAV